MSGKTVPLQNDSRAIAWSLFENRDKLPGRIYAFNAAFGKLAEVVLTNVAEQLNLPSGNATTDDDDDDADFSVDIEGSPASKDYSAVITALKNADTREEAVEALIDAAQSAIEMEHGQKSKSAALKALVQVHARLAGIDVSTAGTGTYPALGKQIVSIRDLLTKLETSSQR